MVTLFNHYILVTHFNTTNWKLDEARVMGWCWRRTRPLAEWERGVGRRSVQGLSPSYGHNTFNLSMYKTYEKATFKI